MDKIFNKTIYVIMHKDKFIFNVYAGNVIGTCEYYTEKGLCISYMIKLQDTNKIINAAKDEIYISLNEAQKEAQRLTINGALFRLAFC